MAARAPLLVSDDAHHGDGRWPSARLWRSWAQWACWHDDVTLDALTAQAPWQLGPLAAAMARRTSTMATSWVGVLNDPATASELDVGVAAEIQTAQRTLRYARVRTLWQALERAESLLPLLPSFVRHGVVIGGWCLRVPRARRLIEALSHQVPVTVTVLASAQGDPLDHEIEVVRALEASTSNIDIQFVTPSKKTIAAWQVPIAASAADIATILQRDISQQQPIIRHLAVTAHVAAAPKATSLIMTPAGRLLVDLLLLHRDHVPRERLLSVWLNPARADDVDALGAGQALRWMQATGVRSDREDIASPRGGYRARLLRMPTTGADSVHAVLPTLDAIVDMVYALPTVATWPEWWDACLTTTLNMTTGWGLGTEELRRCVEAHGRATHALHELAPDREPVGIHRVVTTLTELLSVPFDDSSILESSWQPTVAVFDGHGDKENIGDIRHFHASKSVTVFWHGAAPPSSWGAQWLADGQPLQWQAFQMADANDTQIEQHQHIEHQRLQFFLRQRRGEGAIVGPHSFGVDGRRIERTFGRVFGLADERSRALTPTRVEALAQCRFRGFLESVARIRIEREPAPTLDARVLGTIAHEALEHYYGHRQARRIPVQRHTDDDDRALRAALAAAAHKLLPEATGHRPMMDAALQLLEQQLVRVVKRQAARPPVLAVEPVELEMVVGVELRGPTGPIPPKLGPVPVRMPDGRMVRIGGVIDRVDEGDGGRVVLDYKTMSGSSVRYKGAANQQLVHHFQLPMYLRLLEHHRPTGADVALHGYLLSLRDGTTSEDVGGHSELRALVTDDNREDGLAHALGRVVLPVLNGDLSAMPGDGCEHCGLKRVCRLPLPTQLLAALDESNTAGGS